MSTISIIGSGGMAAAVGGLAAEAGYTVEVVSRDPTKARALAGQVGAGATTGTFGAAPAGDMVILAVPYSAVLDVMKRYGEGLAGKVLVDYRAAAHGEDAGTRLPAVAGPSLPLCQTQQLLNRRQPSRLSALAPPLLASHHS